MFPMSRMKHLSYLFRSMVAIAHNIAIEPKGEVDGK